MSCPGLKRSLGQGSDDSMMEFHRRHYLPLKMLRELTSEASGLPKTEVELVDEGPAKKADHQMYAWIRIERFVSPSGAERPIHHVAVVVPMRQGPARHSDLFLSHHHSLFLPFCWLFHLASVEHDSQTLTYRSFEPLYGHLSKDHWDVPLTDGPSSPSPNQRQRISSPSIPDQGRGNDPF